MSHATPQPQPQDSRVAPAGSLSRVQSQHGFDLAHVDLHALMVELHNRLQNGADPAASAAMISLGDLLQERLAQAVEVHENRFGSKRFHDLFWVFHRHLAEPRPPIAGSTVLDLGCGSANPLGMSMLMILLGAKRTIAVDLDPVQDAPRAARALARLAEAMLQDPVRIVADYPITRDQIAANLHGIDLAALRAGDSAGVGDRMIYRNESAGELSTGDGSCDLVMSNSFLEHIEDLDGVLAEIARVTSKGGYGVHSIDGVDHHSYGDPAVHPLAFLRQAEPGMVHGSNRVRPLEFPALFERHGFAVQQVHERSWVRVDPALVASFAPQWSGMSKQMLEATTVTVVTRKR